MSERHPEGQVTTERRGRLLLIGIDREEKYNGFTPKMFDELTVAYNLLDSDPELWVGVLYGEGNHFTAGLDLPKFVGKMQGGSAFFGGEGVDAFALRSKCRKPLVCAVQGICYTAGIELMLACDIIVASTCARFAQLEPKRGISAFGGATFRFVERCGWGNAMYHLLRADEFTANEAYRIGLVQELVSPGQQLTRALELAAEIAELAPLAVQATKASSLTYATEGKAACVDEFDATVARLSATEDAAEGVKSFVERRKAHFTGR